MLRVRSELVLFEIFFFYFQKTASLCFKISMPLVLRHQVSESQGKTTTTKNNMISAILTLTESAYQK